MIRPDDDDFNDAVEDLNSPSEKLIEQLERDKSELLAMLKDIQKWGGFSSLSKMDECTALIAKAEGRTA